MSCLCIGGVCIPYSALFPMLIIGLQWIAAQFAKVGLLPEFIAKPLGLTTAGKKVNGSDAPSSSCSDSDCCGANAKKKGISSSEHTAATSSESDDDDGDDVEVEHIDTLDRFQEVFMASRNKNSTLIVKFTADWCKPCKAIQPAYEAASSKHPTTKFVTLDIDGDDCDTISSSMKVAMMPTFICFKSGNEAGRMSGGNSGDKLNDWIAEMIGDVVEKPGEQKKRRGKVTLVSKGELELRPSVEEMRASMQQIDEDVDDLLAEMAEFEG